MWGDKRVGTREWGGGDKRVGCGDKRVTREWDVG